MDKIKIIIAHPGKQHSLQLAEAINKNSKYQLTYITTVYDKKNSILMKMIKLLSGKKNRIRANARKTTALKDYQVKTFYTFYGLFRIFLAHYDKSQKYFRKMTYFLANKFGKKVAKFAVKNNFDIVICYDTFCNECFKYIEKESNKKIIKIMDASAANLAYQKQIFEKDLKTNSKFSKKLLDEVKFNLDEKKCEYYIEEANRCDYIIAASNYTKKSFCEIGFPEERVFISPYWIDIEKYTSCNKENNKIVNFSFLGGTKQSKGLSYVLDAFEKLPHNTASLKIVGFDNLSKEIKDMYKGNIEYLGLKLHSEIPEILKNTDVLLFPSLGDGFGFAAAEGMEYECLVIVSENSGISDIIENGKNGFIVKTQSVDDLYNKMKWCVDNKEKIKIIGSKSKKTIEKLTKDRYINSINNIIDNICKEEF